MSEDGDKEIFSFVLQFILKNYTFVICNKVIYLINIYFTISEKLLNSNGRELRRALFSLKQIFQVKSFLLIDILYS